VQTLLVLKKISGANYPGSRYLSGANSPGLKKISGANYPGSGNLSGANSLGLKKMVQTILVQET